MKEDNQEIEKEIQDPLKPYLDAEARRRASATKAPKSEDEGQDDMNDDYAIDGNPPSDDAVRLAISQVPNLAGRRSIQDGADVLKRSYPEITGLRTPEDWERAYVVVEDDYLSGKHLIENLDAHRISNP